MFVIIFIMSRLNMLWLIVSIFLAQNFNLFAELISKDVNYLVKINARIYAITNNSVYAFGKDDDNFPLFAIEAKSSVVTKPTEIVELGNQTIIQLCSSNRHMLALTDNGHIWAWGSNAYGELGLASDLDYYHRPTLIELEAKIDLISCGHLSSYAISSVGDLYSWGWNKYGQLGHGDYDSRNVPTKVNSISNIFNVGTGENWLTIALPLDQSEVYAWGADFSSHPVPLEMNRILVKDVAMIDEMIIMLDNSGVLFKMDSPKDVPKVFYSGDMTIISIEQGGGNRRPQFLIAQTMKGGLLVWWDVHANGQNSFTTLNMRELALRDDINICSLTFSNVFFNLLLSQTAV